MSYCFEDVDGEREPQGPVHGDANIFFSILIVPGHYDGWH
jgi:hypothetical protein